MMREVDHVLKGLYLHKKKTSKPRVTAASSQIIHKSRMQGKAVSHEILQHAE